MAAPAVPQVQRKAIAIVPDEGRAASWQPNARRILEGSGFADIAISMVEVDLRGGLKHRTSTKGKEFDAWRLRYESHEEHRNEYNPALNNLVQPNEELHVLWISHAESRHLIGGRESTKFMPHHKVPAKEATKDYRLSAKELARIIDLLVADASGNRPLYPHSVTLLSCYSGTRRAKWVKETVQKQKEITKDGQTRIKLSEGTRDVKITRLDKGRGSPLGLRVLEQLRVLYRARWGALPTHLCRVAAPVIEFRGMEMDSIRIPIREGDRDWNVTSM